jgi:hypothetical protein
MSQENVETLRRESVYQRRRGGYGGAQPPRRGWDLTEGRGQRRAVAPSAVQCLEGVDHGLMLALEGHPAPRRPPRY